MELKIIITGNGDRKEIYDSLKELAVTLIALEDYEIENGGHIENGVLSCTFEKL